MAMKKIIILILLCLPLSLSAKKFYFSHMGIPSKPLIEVSTVVNLTDSALEFFVYDTYNIYTVKGEATYIENGFKYKATDRNGETVTVIITTTKKCVTLTLFKSSNNYITFARFL